MKPLDALSATLAERGARYGDFTDHARISEAVMQALMSGMGWQRASPAQREALRIISNKLGRIVNGDPNYADSWHDIAGYARLAEARCVPEAPAPAERPEMVSPNAEIRDAGEGGSFMASLR
jgi:hypothetical protein